VLLGKEVLFVAEREAVVKCLEVRSCLCVQSQGSSALILQLGAEGRRGRHLCGSRQGSPRHSP